MPRRLFDVIMAGTALVLLLPLFALAAIGIKLSSRGPVFYLAERAGINGKRFSMYKFRTMHVHKDGRRARITAVRDLRIYPFGSLLRRLKFDEFPQLINVLRGEMSIVGPRPEDPEIVAQYYTEEQRRTLTVVPGMTSPGSLYDYTHGHLWIEAEDVEQAYADTLMPIMLSLENVYVDRSGFFYDVSIIFRTLWIILCVCLGRRRFQNPPELARISSRTFTAQG